MTEQLSAAIPVRHGSGAASASPVPGESDLGGTALPRALPALPLRDGVSFPDTLLPLAIGQERSVALVNDVLAGNRLLVMVASRNVEVETPAPSDLYEVGVVGLVARMLKVPDGSLRVLIQGGQRVRIDRWVAEQPYLIAEISELPDVVRESPELLALARNVQATFSQIVEQVPYLPEELQLAIANVEDPSALGHLIASSLRLKTEEKQALLEEVDVAKRLRSLSQVLARELEVISLGSKIQSQVQSELDRTQREYFLRQQLKAIQDELGETDETVAEANELREQLDALELPEAVRRQADRELSRLAKLPPGAAEHGVIRTWLEWIAALPWGKSTPDDLDLGHARAVLDEDHYDIEQVKERIIEFLAVRRLKPDARGSIMCFVGPPGVGKTSLGRSIARALGRSFERISVGGVRDEAEIRGHRRTYIGALPGTIVRALRDAGSENPLLMIDEIDKLGADWRGGFGGVESAMLELLDPEQNSTFRDHYLDVPVDLSKVMFIATANTLDTVPGPLRDRMEIIQLAGYTEAEKLEIARRYLVPRQIDRNGLSRSRLRISDAALRAVVSDYTREAGVRNLEREIGTIARKIARQVAEGSANGRATISERRARELLGRPRFASETRWRTREPGVATGLAWTPVGGEVLFIEATAMTGAGKLTITGQLGEVMRESAQAALSYVRAHASELAPGLPEDWFATHDLHLHVPAGATPKDGPSAGITMATALASLISDRPVRDDVAMTGEITLTGRVLPIGGLKEKALAAHRNRIKTVIAPSRNAPDIEQMPEHLLRDLSFELVDEIGAVLAVALRRARSRTPSGSAPGGAKASAVSRSPRRV